ncbi:MAG TPA: GFA family protein [Casimicrobiaceae bacterium]|nr:GFA family protein [Casimicrobiaceae bacterium]
MKVQGACHCGAVSFEAEVDPERVTICHCTDCQELTGTAYRVSVPTRRQDFVLLGGAPKTYIKTAESGRKRVQAFCANCGSPIYAHALEDNPATYGLRVGCLDQRRELPPRRQIWCRSALDWALDLHGLPGSERE